MAVAAWTDQGASLDFDRPGAHHPAERIPDIDLIVSRASLNRVKGYARVARCGEFPVSIDTFWSECWIDFRLGSQFSCPTHRAGSSVMLSDTVVAGPGPARTPRFRQRWANVMAMAPS